MKQIVIIFLLAVTAGSSVWAQQAPGVASYNAAASPDETIYLKEPGFDFGKIPQGRPVTHLFELVNRGKEPMVLENVQASCGCTTPEWSEAPISPGALSVIKVGFNAAAQGRFTKVITIKCSGNRMKTFTISGEVYPMPTTSAPLNTSLSLLK